MDLAQVNACVVLAKLLVSSGLEDEPNKFRAQECLSRAEAHGRAWAWKNAANAIRKAFKALETESPFAGEPPEAEGNLWHRGLHPIQAGASAYDDVEDIQDFTSGAFVVDVRRRVVKSLRSFGFEP